MIITSIQQVSKNSIEVWMIMAKEIPNGLEGNQDPFTEVTDHVGQSGARGVAYEIRVKDHLDTYWCEWFEGWTISYLENGEALLSATSVDQSGLHGALNKIRDLNLTLLSVARTKMPPSENNETTSS
jgi:hypothetical protein